VRCSPRLDSVVVGWVGGGLVLVGVTRRRRAHQCRCGRSRARRGRLQSGQANPGRQLPRIGCGGLPERSLRGWQRRRPRRRCRRVPRRLADSRISPRSAPQRDVVAAGGVLRACRLGDWRCRCRHDRRRRHGRRRGTAARQHVAGAGRLVHSPLRRRRVARRASSLGTGALGGGAADVATQKPADFARRPEARSAGQTPCAARRCGRPGKSQAPAVILGFHRDPWAAAWRCLRAESRQHREKICRRSPRVRNPPRLHSQELRWHRKLQRSLRIGGRLLWVHF
jgi:hypothetical protein